MKNIYSLLDAVRNETQLDIYALYSGDETKHAIAESIFASVVAGLVGAYLKGLLAAEEQGKARRAQLKDLFGRARRHEDMDATPIETDAGKTLEQVAQHPVSEDAFKRATDMVIEELVAAGLTREVSESLANKIALQVRQALAG